VGYYDDGSESSGFIHNEEFELLSDYQLLKNGSAVWG
jgi:hypothetical protein